MTDLQLARLFLEIAKASNAAAINLTASDQYGAATTAIAIGDIATRVSDEYTARHDRKEPQ